jgi:formiminoglutamase
MKLPVGVSVPHGGLAVPKEVSDLCILSEEDLVKDSDEGASDVYAVSKHVSRFVAAPVARAIVDVNRSPEDRRPDGVVKTETSYRVPIWRSPLSEQQADDLISRYHRPYHQALEQMSTEVDLAVDCHTMAEIGPPIGPGAGRVRPLICLSDLRGSTLPSGWMEDLAECFAAASGHDVSINDPFEGGFTISTHGRSGTWVQLEFSRSPTWTAEQKREVFLRSIEDFARKRLSP